MMKSQVRGSRRGGTYRNDRKALTDRTQRLFPVPKETTSKRPILSPNDTKDCLKGGKVKKVESQASWKNSEVRGNRQGGLSKG